MSIDRRNCISQVAAVALLACSTLAHADNCAGGMDATGNDCNGGQAARSLNEADSHVLYLKGRTMMAELKAREAMQRESAARAEVKETEAQLRVARKALNDAENATQR